MQMLFLLHLQKPNPAIHISAKELSDNRKSDMTYGPIPCTWRPPLNVRARLKLSWWQIPTGVLLAHLWIPLRFRAAAQYLALTSDLLTVEGVHAPFCTINQNGAAKNSKPQEKKKNLFPCGVATRCGVLNKTASWQLLSITSKGSSEP